MKLFIFILIVISTDAYAKEYIFLTEITPPYSHMKNNERSGVYKEILDHAFKYSKHTYTL